MTEPTTPPSEPPGSEPPSPEPGAVPPPSIESVPLEPVPARRSPVGRQRLIGIGVGLLGYVVPLLLAVVQVGASGDDAGYTALYYAIFAAIASVILIVAGIVLVVIDRTRAFGTGVLIAVAVGIFCGGGICIGLVAGT